MNKAMQWALFVNKRQTILQDIKPPQKLCHMFFFPPIYQNFVLSIFKKVLLGKKRKLSSNQDIAQSWPNNYFDVQCINYQAVIM